MAKIKRTEIDEFDEEEEDDEDYEDELEVEEKKPKLKSKPKTPSRRFGIIAAESMKIVDIETRETIGEGDYAVIQALTDILERLERIETKIGAAIN